MKNDSLLSKGVLDKSKLSDIDCNTLIKEKIVLAGNPNVGKSLFFNYLSGMYVDVSNFPGTTISTIKAKYKNYELYDTPGVYGLSSFNEEEKVARDILVEGDIVLNVVNALHLERDLFFTQQLIDMGLKITVLLNFSDELLKQNIKINTKKLSELLGVEVYKTSAVNKTGFDKLDDAISNARQGNKISLFYNNDFRSRNLHIPHAEFMLLQEGDNDIAEKYNTEKATQEHTDNVFIERRNRVNQIADNVEHKNTAKGEFFNKLGRLCINPLTGLPILAFVLLLVYFFIGDFVSQQVVDFTENTVGKGLFEYNLKSFVADYTPSQITVDIFDADGNSITSELFSFPDGKDSAPELAQRFESLSSHTNAETDFIFTDPIVQLFFGEFGVITMSVTYLFFLLFPLVVGFYFVMAILEDSGYLPRLATMLDKTFTRLGLNGKAVIPIILGFGCVTMANITTRILGTQREKSIATAILQFAIPCSAQLAVITTLLSGTGTVPLIIYVVTIATVLITLSTILNKILPGESSPLLLNLPAMRFPRPINIIRKTFYRAYGFMKEAWIWFFVGSLGVGVLQLTGLLQLWQDILAPVTTSWLKLPKETATAFVMGMVRRDFGAAGLLDMDLTTMQSTVAIITITLFVPCIVSFVIMLKERGWKEGVAVWIGTWLTAFAVGGIVAQIII